MTFSVEDMHTTPRVSSNHNVMLSRTTNGRARCGSFAQKEGRLFCFVSLFLFRQHGRTSLPDAGVLR